MSRKLTSSQDTTMEFDSGTNDYIAQRLASRRFSRTEHHPEPPQIDSDRPIPVEARGGLRNGNFIHFYPFERMRVGDSFWVPEGQKCTAGAMHRFAKRSGWTFISRAQAQDGRPIRTVGVAKRGTRVWRTG